MSKDFLEFVEKLATSGFHEIGDKEAPYHIQVESLSRHPEYILVGFHGLIHRTKTPPPVFHFRSVAAQAGLGLIAISDPSLNLSSHLNLSWYLWNKRHGNITSAIAKLLDKIIERTGKKLILAGGSGGGFAALNIHNHMQRSDHAVSFVWNPRTDVTQYKWPHLKRYYKLCIDESVPRDTKSILKELESRGISYRLAEKNQQRQLIFINGYDHSHLRKHIRRFIKSNDRHILVGDWGNGHTPPSKATIISVIRDISHDRQPAEIIQKNRPTTKQILDKSFNWDYLKETLRCRVTIIDSNTEYATVILSANLRHYFIGYQLLYRIRAASGKVLYDSGYLYGADMCEVYLELTSAQVRQVERGRLEACIEDIQGHLEIFSYRIKDLSAKRSSSRFVESTKSDDKLARADA